MSNCSDQPNVNDSKTLKLQMEDETIYATSEEETFVDYLGITRYTRVGATKQAQRYAEESSAEADRAEAEADRAAQAAATAAETGQYFDVLVSEASSLPGIFYEGMVCAFKGIYAEGDASSPIFYYTKNSSEPTALNLNAFSAPNGGKFIKVPINKSDNLTIDPNFSDLSNWNSEGNFSYSNRRITVSADTQSTFTQNIPLSQLENGYVAYNMDVNLVANNIGDGDIAVFDAIVRMVDSENNIVKDFSQEWAPQFAPGDTGEKKISHATLIDTSDITINPSYQLQVGFSSFVYKLGGGASGSFTYYVNDFSVFVGSEVSNYYNYSNSTVSNLQKIHTLEAETIFSGSVNASTTTIQVPCKIGNDCECLFSAYGNSSSNFTYSSSLFITSDTWSNGSLVFESDDLTVTANRTSQSNDYIDVTFTSPTGTISGIKLIKKFEVQS